MVNGTDGQCHNGVKDRGQQLAVKRTHLQNTRCSSHVHAVTHTKNIYEEQPITASFFTSLTSRTWVFPHCSSVNSEECRANQKFISYSSHQEHICSSCSTGFVLRMSRGKHLLGHMENNQRTSCSTSVEPQEQMKNMCSLLHFAKSCSSRTHENRRVLSLFLCVFFIYTPQEQRQKMFSRYVPHMHTMMKR